VPRSGTTLSCELLNLLADTRALDEPMHVGPMILRATRPDGATLDADTIRAEIADFARDQRRSIMDRGVARSRHVAGRVSGLRVDDRRESSGVRARLSEKGEIAFAPPVSADFTLVIKHPVLFAAMLGELIDHYSVFAVVRNPVAVLGSWESVPMMVRDGQLGLPAPLAPQIAHRLDSISDLLERQLTLLEWYFEIFASTLPVDRVIRYEEIISSGGSVLAPIAPSAKKLRVSLAGRNRAPIYDHDRMRAAGRLLLERNHPSWQAFYPWAAIEDFVNSIKGR
jgi:hypothetical protein